MNMTLSCLWFKLRKLIGMCISQSSKLRATHVTELQNQVEDRSYFHSKFVGEEEREREMSLHVTHDPYMCVVQVEVERT